MKTEHFDAELIATEYANQYPEKDYHDLQHAVIYGIIAHAKHSNGIKYNSITPVSQTEELSKYQPIRDANLMRDSKCSPLHDCIMDAICERLKEYGDRETFNKLWTSSLFPERLTKQLLRITENFLNQLDLGGEGE